MIFNQRSLREVLGRGKDALEKSLDAFGLIVLMDRGPFRILRTNLRCEQSYCMLIDAYVVHNGDGPPNIIEIVEFQAINRDKSRGLRGLVGIPADLKVIALESVFDVL